MHTFPSFEGLLGRMDACCTTAMHMWLLMGSASAAENAGSSPHIQLVDHNHTVYRRLMMLPGMRHHRLFGYPVTLESQEYQR